MLDSNTINCVSNLNLDFNEAHYANFDISIPKHSGMLSTLTSYLC